MGSTSIEGSTIDFSKQFIIEWLVESQFLPIIKSKPEKGRQIKFAMKDLLSIRKRHFKQHG